MSNLFDKFDDFARSITGRPSRLSEHISDYLEELNTRIDTGELPELTKEEFIDLMVERTNYYEDLKGDPLSDPKRLKELLIENVDMTEEW